MHPTVTFIAGFLVLFVGAGARFAVGLTLNPMVGELGWARGEIGLAVFAYLVVSVVATYLAGRLADRTSPSLLINAGVVISGLGIGFTGRIGAPWHAVALYGVVFAIGNGMASLTPVGVMVTRAFGRARFANSAVISGMSLGQLVMIAGWRCCSCGSGWRSAFVWLGGAHLALFPFLLWALPRRAEAKERPGSPRPGSASPKPRAHRTSGCCWRSTPSAGSMTSSSPRMWLCSPRIAAWTGCWPAISWPSWG